MDKIPLNDVYNCPVLLSFLFSFLLWVTHSLTHGLTWYVSKFHVSDQLIWPKDWWWPSRMMYLYTHTFWHENYVKCHCFSDTGTNTQAHTHTLWETGTHNDQQQWIIALQLYKWPIPAARIECHGINTKCLRIVHWFYSIIHHSGRHLMAKPKMKMVVIATATEENKVML